MIKKILSKIFYCIFIIILMIEWAIFWDLIYIQVGFVLFDVLPVLTQ